MKIVVTGATKGIGKAIVERFIEDNLAHHFFLCARNEKELNELKKEIESIHTQHTVTTLACDLQIKEEVKNFATLILHHSQAVDILINNAGLYFPGSCYNEDDGVLEKMLNVNLFSAYHLSRAILPPMIENKKGHIFNICSIAALKAYANGGSYSISKYALSGFTKNLREELKAFNIKVTGVYPGATYSDSWKGSGVEESRIMNVTDIAKMIYAASHLSPQAVVEDIIIRPQLGDI